MTISNVTILSSFTDNAPLSPTYFNAKWEEARSNFSRLADAAQSTLSGAGLLFASEYGVAADGSTNDTTAVQNVLTTAAATGKTAIFSAGTHRLVGPISFPSTVKAQGAGKDGTIFYAGTAAMTTISTASQDVWIDGIYFKGTGATNSGERGVDTAASNVRVTNCRFGYLTNGVRFSGASASDGVVSGCEFSPIVGNYGTSEGYGVLASGWRTRVANNLFLDNKRHAVYLSSTASGCIVTGNVISRVSEHAIQVYATTAQDGCFNNVVANNVISDITQAAGIAVSDNAQQTIVSGNHISSITGTNAYGIIVRNGTTSDKTLRCRRTLVQGNYVENTSDGFDCVIVLNADETLVANNVLLGNVTGYGVQVYTATLGSAETRSRQNVIHGNYISNCTRPIYLNGSDVSQTRVGFNSFYSNISDAIRNTSAVASGLSSELTVQVNEMWASGLSVGGTGTLIPAISSTSSLIGAFVVQGSSSSFTIVTWAAAKANDIIMVTPTSLNAAVSSLSSGIAAHSHCTQNGQVELRLSNCSTLAQNVSSKTWYFTRITPF